MIASSFFDLANVLLDYIMSTRPNWQPTLDPSIAQMMQGLTAWDWLLPVHEVVTCVGVAFALLTALIAWKWTIKIADWVADVIP